MSDSGRYKADVLRGPVQFSHILIGSIVGEGDCAVDATCGNGHDTLMLARLVGESGHVWAFDIQSEAVEETGRKLAAAVLSERVTLVKQGHENLRKHVGSTVKAVLFNLGYLPGGSRDIITAPDTTVSALEQAFELLEPGGFILVAIYPGHNGGVEEQSAVESWAALPRASCHAWRMSKIAAGSGAPYLLLVQKD